MVAKKLFYVHLHLGNWGTFWFFNWVETTIPFGWCLGQHVSILSRWLVGQTVSTRWICQENWQGLFPTAKGWRATTRWWSGTYFSVHPFFGEMIFFTHAVLFLLPKGAACTTWIMHLLLGESYGGYDRGRESWIGRRDVVQVFMEGTYFSPHCMESYLQTCQCL